MTYLPVSEFSYKDSMQLDAFWRLRVSEQEQLIDLKQLVDKLPLFFDEVIWWAGTSVHSPITASTTMWVTWVWDYVIRQTKRRFNYSAGKSQLSNMTFSWFQPEVGVEKEVWYFNSSSVAPYNTWLDWLLLRSAWGIITAYTYRSWTITNQANQADRNIDKMDWTWPSWVTLDWLLWQILIPDFQYLGLGRVRFAFSVNWQTYPIHEFDNANNLVDVYMTSPNHSIRYGIRSTWGAGTFKMVCASVSSEWSNNTIGMNYSLNRWIVPLSAPTTGIKYVSQAYRLATWYEWATVNFTDITLTSSSNDDVLWELILNPTIAWALVYGTVTNTAVEHAIWATANTVTWWFVLASWGLKQNTTTWTKKISALLPWVNINGSRDVVALVVTPASTGVTLTSTIDIVQSL